MTQFTGKQNLYFRFADELLDELAGLVAPTGKTLLDLACGGGFLVDAAQRRGFVASGLEANADVVAWCRSRGLDVHQGTIRDATARTEPPYDVVVLSAILEHLPDPEELLARCHDLLADDGLVLVAQASFDGLLPRVLPWGWYGWQPVEHFWHFTPSSFLRMADIAGFVPVRVHRNSLHHPWFTSGGVKLVIGRNLAAAIGHIAQRLGRGDQFHAVLRKRHPEG